MTISGGNGQSASRAAVARLREEAARAAEALREARERGAAPTELVLLRDHLAAVLEALRRLRGRAV